MSAAAGSEKLVTGAMLPDETALRPDDVAGQLQLVLLRLWNWHRSNEAASSTAGQLHAAQAAILSELAARGPVRVSDLAASLRVRPPSITVTVDRLMRLGLVTRWARSIDQREVRIDITGRGRDVHRKSLVANNTRTVAAVARLSLEDQEALRCALPVLGAVAQALWDEQQRSAPGG